MKCRAQKPCGLALMLMMDGTKSRYAEFYDFVLKVPLAPVITLMYCLAFQFALAKINITYTYLVFNLQVLTISSTITFCGRILNCDAFISRLRLTRGVLVLWNIKAGSLTTHNFPTAGTRVIFPCFGKGRQYSTRVSQVLISLGSSLKSRIHFGNISAIMGSEYLTQSFSIDL